MVEHLADVKRFHREHIEPLLAAPRGATEREIRDLEAALGGAVPAAYREYLLWMGKDDDGPFQGTNCFIDDVVDNNRGLATLLRENDVDFELPRRFLTFFMHQGYEAAWFDLETRAPDPECWAFSEGSTDVPERAGRLSSFLMEQLEGLLPAIRAVVKSRRQ